ncbi:MAG: hypothetical protein Tsb0010_13240 [Parvularculaceae bacterium]
MPRAQRTNEKLLRAPQQARSRATLERVFAAMEARLAAAGPDALKVKDIAREAGCSTGAIYERFKDREALIVAFYAQLEVRIRSETETFFAAADLSALPLEVGIDAFVDFVFGVYARDGALLVGLVALGREFPSLRATDRRLIEFGAEKLEQFLTLKKDAIKRPDIAVMAETIARILIGVLYHTISMAAGQGADAEEIDRLRRECKCMARAYIAS